MKSLTKLAAQFAVALCGLLLFCTFAVAQLPCDIYASAGTPCVAAHSTTRALFASYNGSLYQVQRSSDNTTLNIGLLQAGGYANSAAQDSFCANTSCTVTRIYDQSSYHNDLTVEGAGGNGKADSGVSASALPVMAGGHKVYGLSFSPDTGYRDDSTTGVAKNGQPEGMYMVASGTDVDNWCCMDYGNAETSNTDTGNGHMDAVNISTLCWFGSCYGSGPWVQADIENGLFQSNVGYSLNPSNTGWPDPFVTAILKNNGQTEFSLRAGNAQSGGLTTEYDGGEPANYAPFHQEGAIVLGTGGDNSNLTYGQFFEGVMTSGYPADATENAVQANIVSVGYSTSISACSTTNPIIPYISVAGVWSAAGETTVTVASGTAVNLGPQPLNSGTWSWSGPNGYASTSREIDNIALSVGVNTYTATYTLNGCTYNEIFTITIPGAGTAITPYLQVNGAAWQQTNMATVASGSTVNLGPGPQVSGTWSWTGPNGFTSTSREIDNIALSAGVNTYTVTLTNSSGAKSTESFSITVPGAGTAITPYLQVNDAAWQQTNIATVASGSTVNLGPQPVSGGSWSWSGPNGFTSTSREIDSIPLTVGTETFVATYTNTSGVKSTETFTVTVTSGSTGQAPCDIFANDGHACVAAYSSTRALFAAYNGHLYQVHRTSDSTYLDIATTSAGGHANAAVQNTFCANTTCTITKLYDQTTDGNDMSVAGPGANVQTADSPVSATALPVTVGGNQVYGMYFDPGMGYRNDNTKGMPINAEPEGAYMVASGTHFDQYCCFDFGNAEVGNGYPSPVNPQGGGEGHMDAINFGSGCWFDSCYGSGPWVQLDFECCGKNGTTTNSDDTGLTMPFITAYLRNEGVGNYYLDGGDATKANGNLSFFAGPLPSGYSPMHQEGAILLGIGGDNADWGAGNFFEGAITAGVYSNAALNSIQANVAAAQYALQ